MGCSITLLYLLDTLFFKRRLLWSSKENSTSHAFLSKQLCVSYCALHQSWLHPLWPAFGPWLFLVPGQQEVHEIFVISFHSFQRLVGFPEACGSNYGKSCSEELTCLDEMFCILLSHLQFPWLPCIIALNKNLKKKKKRERERKIEKKCFSSWAKRREGRKSLAGVRFLDCKIKSKWACSLRSAPRPYRDFCLEKVS